MFVIFGLGHQKDKKVGDTAAMDCPRCHNTTPYIVTKRSTYFTLFFLPIFPYSSCFLLSCPVCRETREISEQDKDRLLGGASQ